MHVPDFNPFLQGDFDLTYTAPEQGVHTFVNLAPSGAPSSILFSANQCFGDNPAFPPAPCPQDNDVFLMFGTGLSNVPLTVGTYNNAVRDTGDFPAQPGLNWGFRHYGPDNILGSFTITDLEFHVDSSGRTVIDSFDASFLAHLENTGPIVTGTFSYDANPVPEPRTTAVLIIVLLGYGVKNFRRRIVC